MNSNKTQGNKNNTTDLAVFDIAISGSEANEQEVPDAELLNDYTGTDDSKGEQNG